jgi:hypothetical protein
MQAAQVRDGHGSSEWSQGELKASHNQNIVCQFVSTPWQDTHETCTCRQAMRKCERSTSVETVLAAASRVRGSWTPTTAKVCGWGMSAGRGSAHTTQALANNKQAAVIAGAAQVRDGDGSGERSQGELESYKPKARTR